VYYIAVHAVVSNNVTVYDEDGNEIGWYWETETAWGDGTQFNEGKSWAMYITYRNERGG
jgi:hypothetical protein